MKQSIEARFYSKVNKTETCWIWTGCLGTRGYGLLSIEDKMIKAHRYSYELHNGPIPAGLFVCHKCDNPSCVNPDHLFLGTPKDNCVDMVNKGRNKRPDLKGEHCAWAKLTQVDVDCIKKSYQGGYGEVIILAKRYGVNQSTISRVINNISWRG